MDKKTIQLRLTGIKYMPSKCLEGKVIIDAWKGKTIVVRKSRKNYQKERLVLLVKNVFGEACPAKLTGRTLSNQTVAINEKKMRIPTCNPVCQLPAMALLLRAHIYT